MTYVPSVKMPETSDFVLQEARSFDEWKAAWERATHYWERIGLIHEIYDTIGGQRLAFRWLLETADELCRPTMRLSSYGRHLGMQIAAAAVEQAVRRSLKVGNLGDFYSDPEQIACLFWFMRIENDKFLNMSRIRIREPHNKLLWDAFHLLCERTLSVGWDRLHPYRREAVYMLHAAGRLQFAFPDVTLPEITGHPWTAFDDPSLEALLELSLQDARKLGGETVDFALVHGSQAAALYTTASRARDALHRKQFGE